jgi:hypothetical protein
MPTYINIGGRLCVNTIEYGPLYINDYESLIKLNPLESKGGSKNDLSDDITVNIKLISNEYPRVLSMDEVLDVFVQYIHKYRKSYRKFDIPVGTKYLEYSDYIHEKLKWAFPNINWRIKVCTNFYICTGEYTN